MTTMAMNRTNTMNANAEKAMGSTRMSLMDRIHKYFTDNAYYFACVAASNCHSGHVAAQIMRDAREAELARAAKANA